MQQAAQQWDKPEDVKEESLLKRGTSKTATRSAPRHANRTLAAATHTLGTWTRHVASVREQPPCPTHRRPPLA